MSAAYSHRLLMSSFHFLLSLVSFIASLLVTFIVCNISAILSSHAFLDLPLLLSAISFVCVPACVFCKCFHQPNASKLCTFSPFYISWLLTLSIIVTPYRLLVFIATSLSFSIYVTTLLFQPYVRTGWYSALYSTPSPSFLY